jgi:hypothetical protein
MKEKRHEIEAYRKKSYKSVSKHAVNQQMVCH